MEKVRFGIIGVGNIGSAHLKTLHSGEIDGAVVTAVADVREDRRARALSVAPDVTVYNSGDELIDNADVDAVIVAVPHYFHPSLSIRALERGLSVICEKPAGVYTKQVKEMLCAAHRSKGLFTMMFNQRTNCIYRKMREIVRDGGIGTIKRVNWIITDWYRTQAYYDSGDWRATWSGEGGGVLFNQCPHQIDLLQWVTGMTPARVSAHCHFGKWHNIEVEDDVTVYMEYENGATGVFVTSTADAPGTNRFEILGTLGKLVCENNKLYYTKNDVDERKYCFESENAHMPPKQETVDVVTDGKNPQHAGIIQNFTDALLGKDELMVNGDDGLLGVEFMDACLLSQWLGKTVQLPIDDDLYLSELEKRIKTSRRKENVNEKSFDMSGSYGSEKK